MSAVLAAAVVRVVAVAQVGAVVAQVGAAVGQAGMPAGLLLLWRPGERPALRQLPQFPHGCYPPRMAKKTSLKTSHGSRHKSPEKGRSR